jgi:hypothetical protein
MFSSLFKTQAVASFSDDLSTPEILLRAAMEKSFDQARETKEQWNIPFPGIVCGSDDTSSIKSSLYSTRDGDMHESCKHVKYIFLHCFNELITVFSGDEYKNLKYFRGVDPETKKCTVKIRNLENNTFEDLPAYPAYSLNYFYFKGKVYILHLDQNSNGFIIQTHLGHALLHKQFEDNIYNVQFYQVNGRFVITYNRREYNGMVSLGKTSLHVEFYSPEFKKLYETKDIRVLCACHKNYVILKKDAFQYQYLNLTTNKVSCGGSFVRWNDKQLIEFNRFTKRLRAITFTGYEDEDSFNADQESDKSSVTIKGISMPSKMI